MLGSAGTFLHLTFSHSLPCAASVAVFTPAAVVEAEQDLIYPGRPIGYYGVNSATSC